MFVSREAGLLYPLKNPNEFGRSSPRSKKIVYLCAIFLTLTYSSPNKAVAYNLLS